MADGGAVPARKVLSSLHRDDDDVITGISISRPFIAQAGVAVCGGVEGDCRRTVTAAATVAVVSDSPPLVQQRTASIESLLMQSVKGDSTVSRWV